MPKPTPGRRKKKKSTAKKATAAQSPPSLEDIVVALQKSFSRVSRDSGEFKSNNPDEAVAFVEGPIKFSITVKLNPEGDHKLTYHEQGGMETKIEGTINPDIRYEPEEAEQPKTKK